MAITKNYKIMRTKKNIKRKIMRGGAQRPAPPPPPAPGSEILSESSTDTTGNAFASAVSARQSGELASQSNQLAQITITPKNILRVGFDINRKPIYVMADPTNKNLPYKNDQDNPIYVRVAGNRFFIPQKSLEKLSSSGMKNLKANSLKWSTLKSILPTSILGMTKTQQIANIGALNTGKLSSPKDWKGLAAKTVAGASAAALPLHIISAGATLAGYIPVVAATAAIRNKRRKNALAKASSQPGLSAYNMTNLKERIKQLHNKAAKGNQEMPRRHEKSYVMQLFEPVRTKMKEAKAAKAKAANQARIKVL